MTIKNIGSKIISVGSTVLMPDASMKASKAVCEAPAIKALAEMGVITISDEAGEGKPKNKSDVKAKTGPEKADAQK